MHQEAPDHQQCLGWPPLDLGYQSGPEPVGTLAEHQGLMVGVPDAAYHLAGCPPMALDPGLPILLQELLQYLVPGGGRFKFVEA